MNTFLLFNFLFLKKPQIFFLYIYRSVEKDLEAQFTIVTRNETLQKALHEESERLFEHSKAVKDSKSIGGGERIPLWVNCVVDLFRKFF